MYKDSSFLIAICDDNEFLRSKINAICEDIKKTYKNDISIIEFEDGYEVIQFTQKIDLLILDIEMPKMNGLEVKQRLQDRGIETGIIFVTDYEEHMPKAFGLHVIGFVPKDQLDLELPFMIRQAMTILQPPYVLLAENINSLTITFIKAVTPYCHIFFQNGNNELIRDGIDHLTELLQEVDFIRVHRSYLVNLKYIDTLPKQYIQVSGHRIPISRRMRTKVKEAYLDYAMKNARYI